MNSVFNEQILAEKLSKLNSTQQCIETLSHWCIFHRSKAEQVVATWDKQFHSAEMVQKVPLLYLANDILQNSKRNGKEFVTEFWRVLPAAVKEVSEKGNDHGKNAASRLIDIWEERKVFGSHTKSLKDVMLGEELPGPLEVGRKRSHSVTIVKRDSRSIRTKLSIGGTAEKIVSAFHLVLSEHHSEDEEMTKCKSAVHRIRKMEKDVEMALKKAKDQNRKTLARELKDEENLLKQCIEKLTVVEANRVALISQLREALHEQEAELENVSTQMQVAQAQAEEAGNMWRWLDDENYIGVAKLSSKTSLAANTNSNAGQTTKKTAAAIAAEVADKLAASSSSQYIMSSVLSTFAAEEAKNAGVTKSSAASSSFPLFPVNSVSSSMLKPENPLPDPSVFISVQPINPYQLQQASMQGQVSNSQPQYHSLSNPHSQQLLQPTGGLASSFHYGSIPPLPPGPPPAATASYMLSPMVPLTQQQLHMTQQQPMIMGHQPSALTQQQSVPLPQPPLAPPSFRPLAPMQSPGMVYYSHPHHPQ